MTDAELAALWRRHFEVYDDLVYGFMIGESARRAALQRRWWRRARRWRPPGWYSLVWHVWHALRVCAPELVHRFDEHLRARSDRADAARRLNPAAVSYGDLAGARHILSGARFQRPTVEAFAASDPLAAGYLGRVETEFVRTRREVGNEWA